MKATYTQISATKKNAIIFIIALIAFFSIVSHWWLTRKNLFGIQTQKQLYSAKANCETLVLNLIVYKNNPLNSQESISLSSKRLQQQINKIYITEKSPINSLAKILGNEFEPLASIWKFELPPQIQIISNNTRVDFNASDRTELIQEFNILCAGLRKASDSINNSIVFTLEASGYMHNASIVILILLSCFIFKNYRNLYSNNFSKNTAGNGLNKLKNNNAHAIETKANIEQYISSLNTAHKALTQLVEEPESTKPFALLLNEIERITSAISSAIFIAPSFTSQLTLLVSTDPSDQDWFETVPSKILPRVASLNTTNKEIEFFEETAQSEYKFLCVRLRQRGQNFSLLILKLGFNIKITDQTTLTLLEHSNRLACTLSSVHLARLKLRSTQYEERAVIARELHDSLAQSLSYLKIKTSRLQNILTGSNIHACKEFMEIDVMMQDLRSNLNIAYYRLRELISTFRLTLGGKKFPQALNDSVEEFAKRSGIAFDIDNRLPVDILSVTEETQLLHIIRESLSNVVRHSQAKFSLISIHYSKSGQVVAMVEDDGIGLLETPDHEQHLGIIIMQERAHSIGGSVSLSKRKHGGACLKIFFQASRHVDAASNL